MTVEHIPCNPINHGSRRTGPVSYLVVHYTGVPGDTAENNGRYFARADTGKTSAHYFVDEHKVVASVPEELVAYHCGGAVYRHPHCRNGNSIGVEICTKGDETGYAFAPGALENAKTLLRELMARHKVPLAHVIRHYDVTGKRCPMPFVEDPAAWEQFKGGLVLYQTLEQVPQWAQNSVKKLLDRGLLQGTGDGLDLTQDLTRILVILDRAGIFEKEEAYGKDNTERGGSDQTQPAAADTDKKL